MCGIAGFITTNNLFKSPDEIICRMTDTIVHRGPDTGDTWIDTNAGIALGHRRLSILDLSLTGNQPMMSHSERYVVVFNGEIYNYRDIRAELDAIQLRTWQGHSDTEVMLSAIEEWGITSALEHFVGMFAFALWDRKERSLTIARDRLGEKPLYYGWCKGIFLFASELKALRAHPAFNIEIDRNALALFLRHNYIPAPYSIYKGIHKLLPGTYLTVRADQQSSTSTTYWSAHATAEKWQGQPFGGSDREAVDMLELLLRQAVGQQMIADVPLGAFLSGGVDSSLIVALMQSQSNTPVKTFTIGFHEEGFNEANHAKAVARHLGTDHMELYVTPQQALDVIPRLPHLFDEPFSDSSQIPTFLVSQMTQQHVTVSLSGDAGDELFGGYERYVKAQMLWDKIRHIPELGRRALIRGIRMCSSDSWNGLTEPLQRILPDKFTHRPVGDRLHLLANILSCNQPEALYRQMVSHWKNPADVVIGASEPPTILTDKEAWPFLTNFENRMMYLDVMSYLPDDILVKVDRAAMGVSLETRVPFLDHRLVEFAWSLPLSMKIRNGQGKWILKQVLNKYVPKAIMERPKMGFGIPIDSWLRGPLRDWAESLLNEERLRREGFFHPEPIRQKWQEHLLGTRNWHYYLWDILMFQAWLEVWGKPSE